MYVAAFLIGGAIGVQIAIVGLATYGLGMWGKGKKRGRSDEP